MMAATGLPWFTASSIGFLCKISTVCLKVPRLSNGKQWNTLDEPVSAHSGVIIISSI